MKVTVIAPYSRLYGQKGELEQIDYAGLVGNDMAKVRIAGRLITFTLDELCLSSDDKEKIAEGYRDHLIETGLI